MTFKRSLHRRMTEADRQRTKYRHDPAHRLHRVNACRAREGMTPHGNVDEIGSISPARAEFLARFRFTRRILTDEQAERVRGMRRRGLTWTAIAAWFTRNGTPISWQTARRAYDRDAA